MAWTNDFSQEMPEVDSSCQIWLDQELQNCSNIADLANDPLFAQVGNECKMPTPEDSICVKDEKDCLPSCMKKKKSCFEPPDCSTDSVCSTSADSVACEDEFDVYGKYIASQLRQMELNKALRLQLEIQNLVSEARISELTKKC
ncbi:uncharacterized protein [Battus philenor]|uniref:uncharacterized protein isoform X2 n=1 Tax=Battus philenor TaxID=42288 RepID=UPI0035CF990D